MPIQYAKSPVPRALFDRPMNIGSDPGPRTLFGIDEAVAAEEVRAMRPLSKVAPDWWDYTTLDTAILSDAARLSADDLPGLAREGFAVRFYDSLEDFYLAEALEYITSWQQATADKPAG